MNIIFNEQTKEFHIFNNNISYIIKVLRNGQLGQLYFGKKIRHRDDFGHLIESKNRPMTQYMYEKDYSFSLEHLKQEYPCYGTTDYRYPAFEIKQENGSTITEFEYVSHNIFKGKKSLKGLPATYVESDEEAMTLEVLLKDKLTEVELTLSYTIFEDYDVIARNARFENKGEKAVDLTRALSLNLDLPDYNYEWIHLSGAWSRERYIKTRKLEMGIQAISSTKGISSNNQNPFIALKRPETTETLGEAIGFSLVYSGNFLAQIEVDTYDVSRVSMGINPFGFTWHLDSKEEFQTPEAVIVYSGSGLNTMSQTFHNLFGKRLARGEWRDKVRPILVNNWEGTYFDFDDEKILNIARAAKEDGIELFVLDDGWFGTRNDDHQGLGDWFSNREKLQDGVEGLSHKIEELGMKFGLWFEPEMVNKNSELFRKYPDWILHAPGRNQSHGRNQFVLDYSRKEVVDYIYNMMAEVIRNSKISYIKWDMNRCLTECYSVALPPERQGEVFHRYVLGVYDLYDRLTKEFPHILFESCSSGGARFDAAMLYYAPQCWTSDDTDAIERLKIQYGTSMVYPVSSMGAHVSVTPNHQVQRMTPIETRANVAFFGAFGYELDMSKLSEEEHRKVREQVEFFKEYREIFQFGTFYRLLSPFISNIVSWMVVSKDQKTALVGYYKVLNDVNCAYRRVKLQGLNPEFNYTIANFNNPKEVATQNCYGDELMNLGLLTTDPSSGQVLDGTRKSNDFDSTIFILKSN